MNDTLNPHVLASPILTVAIRIYKHSGNCAYTIPLPLLRKAMELMR